MRSSSGKTSRAALATLTVATIILFAGCHDLRRQNFYAARGVRIGATRGDASLIVRARPAGLLSRERRAMALGER